MFPELLIPSLKKCTCSFKTITKTTFLIIDFEHVIVCQKSVAEVLAVALAILLCKYEVWCAYSNMHRKRNRKN